MQGLTAMAKQSKRKDDDTVRIVPSANGAASSTDLTTLRPNGQVQHASADADRQIDSAIQKLGTTLGDSTSVAGPVRSVSSRPGGTYPGC